MKILQLQSENFKRISVVNITPDGNLVEITGKNGQGKSSVLESIWVALGGAKHIQSVPIRKGAKEARIRLNLGDINVTRTFREGADGGYTTKIVVETAEGFRATKPQEILDDLFGSLTFDPLAFTRMKPKDQFDELRQFVPDIDFEGVERDNKKDFERRTDLNRQAKQSRAAADLIVVPLNLPVHELDISDMLDRFERAGKANSEIELRTERRRNTQQRVDQLRLDATQIVATVGDRQAEISKKAAEKCADFDRRVQALQEQIRVLLEQSVAVTQKCDEDVAAVATRATEAATAKTREADELTLKLEEAGPLPEPVDLAALRAEIEEARSTNALIARRDTRTAHLVQADDAEAAAKDLTATMEARTAAKEAAIAAAALPVPGITFGDGAILLNGLPFNQASSAEQLRTSVAIGMASAPALRVMLVRDGSLLDEDGMRLLGEMAEEHDCQVWVETVRSDGRVGFVLEDGHLASTPATRAAAPQADLLGAAE